MEIIKDERRLNELLLQYKLPGRFRNFEKYRPYFHLVRFEKNEVIYRTEFQRQYLIFFLRGKVQVCSNLSNGKSMLVCFYTSFQLLGDLEFCGIDTLSISLHAVEPCICITLQIPEIRLLLEKDDLFLRFLSQSLAKKLEASTINSSINLLYPLENRLASYLCQTSENGCFSENLTQLAELLCTSYRHLLRVIKSFQNEGILCREPSGYRITNPERLTELAFDLYST